MTPRVSVITCVFNGPRYLKEAIQSLLNQSFRDFELIAINDGSTDGTSALLDTLADKRLIVINNDQNLGIAEARNRAFKVARGEYLALQDHDDISRPQRLAVQVNYLDTNSHCALVGSSCSVIDENGVRIGHWDVPRADIDLKWALLTHNPFVNSAVMFRRSVLDQAGCYDASSRYRFAEDYDLHSRIAAGYGVANLAEPLVEWRSHSLQASIVSSQVQEVSAASIARGNLTALLGGETLDDRLWRALKVLLLSKPEDQINLGAKEVHDVASLIKRLQEAFYYKYEFSRPAVAHHRKKLSWTVGRHLLALTYRRNGHTDVSCRSALFLTGIRFLSDVLAFSPVTPKQTGKMRLGRV